MRICIFGASSEVENRYAAAVESLGETLAARGHSLVFGGYSKGLMRAAADGFSRRGAAITGVIPTFFESSDNDYEGCTELLQVGSLAERKAVMLSLSDAFIAVPGGIGTMDELFEVLALRQIGRLAKPVILYDLYAYYEPLCAWLDEMKTAGFSASGSRELLSVCRTPEEAAAVLDRQVSV